MNIINLYTVLYSLTKIYDNHVLIYYSTLFKREICGEFKIDPWVVSMYISPSFIIHRVLRIRNVTTIHKPCECLCDMLSQVKLLRFIQHRTWYFCNKLTVYLLYSCRAALQLETDDLSDSCFRKHNIIQQRQRHLKNSTDMSYTSIQSLFSKIEF